ncbi:hypothetical protein XHV734_p0019 (plasmid) [Xanthomonas hortorum pv. vitians]|nr:hypothetical protein XHV734_p0019 [Xanthomonas hortorum pv. vitians]
MRLHDAAATGNPAGPSTGDPDAPAAGITLSGIAGTIADNSPAATPPPRS